jgi:uncharacterized protein (TIGR04255 family)
MDRDRLPTKLRDDAILEAVLEIRFEPAPAAAPAPLPEIFIGRFADNEAWRGFRHARTAAADIPAPLRQVDPNLRYVPLIEMTSPDGGRVLRIGPQAVSYSRRGAYPGWAGGFGEELRTVVEHLYRVLPDAQVSRLGLRYINALKSTLHGIRNIGDLAIKIAVGERSVSAALNLNFKTNVGTDFETMTRIATMDLAEGIIPEHATVIVDVDVYTSSVFATSDVGAVERWVEEAHDQEKTTFFEILGAENTERLRER